MKDKIEVGEYVRFKIGEIDEIKDIFDTHGERKLIAFEKRNSYLSDLGLKKQIVKHSKNIIDLIEEGDYVNGHLVANKKNDEGRMEIAIESDHIIYYWIEEKDIESIVTKEQFNNIKYEIKEK